MACLRRLRGVFRLLSPSSAVTGYRDRHLPRGLVTPAIRDCYKEPRILGICQDPPQAGQAKNGRNARGQPQKSGAQAPCLSIKHLLDTAASEGTNPGSLPPLGIQPTPREPTPAACHPSAACQPQGNRPRQPATPQQPANREGTNSKKRAYKPICQKKILICLKPFPKVRRDFPLQWYRFPFCQTKIPGVKSEFPGCQNEFANCLKKMLEILTGLFA